MDYPCQVWFSCFAGKHKYLKKKNPVADGYQVMEIAYIAYDQASLKLT
jgi:hypothetical protein